MTSLIYIIHAYSYYGVYRLFRMCYMKPVSQIPHEDMHIFEFQLILTLTFRSNFGPELMKWNGGWNTGMEYWNGILDWITLILKSLLNRAPYSGN